MRRPDPGIPGGRGWKSAFLEKALRGLKKVEHFSNKVGSLDTSKGQQAGNRNVWVIQGGIV